MHYQDPGTDNLILINDLHDRCIYYLIILLVLIMWVFISSLTWKTLPIQVNHSNLIEFVWTLAPAGILWGIGIPSLSLLFRMDELLDASITVKVIGNQWYWSYEYSDYDNPISFDSFLITDLTNPGDLRMLAVDNSLVLPVLTSIRLLITSNDVIHSFAIPSLALKCDAIPGRLNSVGLSISRPSTYYGQCSELCGINHGFMPIQLKAVSLINYLNFIQNQSSGPLTLFNSPYRSLLSLSC